MNNPKYNPGLWVLFKMGDGAAFGKIKGGNLSSDAGWIYYVENTSNPADVFKVAEVDISAKSDGGDWAEIQAKEVGASEKPKSSSPTPAKA